MQKYIQELQERAEEGTGKDEERGTVSSEQVESLNQVIASKEQSLNELA